jgi:hypothetical protein
MAKNDLRVKVTADSKEYDKAIQDIRNSTKKAKKDIDGLGSGANKLSTSAKSISFKGMTEQLTSAQGQANSLVDTLSNLTIKPNISNLLALSGQIKAVFDQVVKISVQSAGNTVADSLVKPLDMAAFAAKALPTALASSAAATATLATSAGVAAEGIQRLTQTQITQRAVLANLMNQYSKFFQTTQTFNSNAAYAQMFRNATNAAKPAYEAITKLASSNETLTVGFNNLGKAGDKGIKVLSNLGKQLIETNGQSKEFAANILKISSKWSGLAIKLGSGSFNSLKGSIASASASIVGMISSVNILAVALSGLALAATSVALALSNTERGADAMSRFTAFWAGSFTGLKNILTDIGGVIVDIVAFINTPLIWGMQEYASETAKATMETNELQIALRKLAHGTEGGSGLNLYNSQIKGMSSEFEAAARSTEDAYSKVTLLTTAKDLELKRLKNEVMLSEKNLEIIERQHKVTSDNGKDQIELDNARVAHQETVNALKAAETSWARKILAASKEASTYTKKIADEAERNNKAQQQAALALEKQWDFLKQINVKEISALEETEEVIARREEAARKMAEAASQYWKAAIKYAEPEEEDVNESWENTPIYKQWKAQEEAAQKAKEDAERVVTDFQKHFSEMIGENTVSTFSDLMQTAFEGGDMGQAALAKLGELLKQFGEALMAYAIAVDAFKKCFKNPWLALAAGTALVVAGSYLSAKAQKVQDFADGGIVYGETYARVAEYQGASNNPEVIAPLNRLKSLIADTVNEGGTGGRVVFDISGDHLVGVLNNHNRRSRKLG